MSSSDERVETLARSLYRETDLNLALSDQYDIDCHDVARALLDSPAMRDLLAEERAKALREAADEWPGVQVARRPINSWLRDRADKEADR